MVGIAATVRSWRTICIRCLQSNQNYAIFFAIIRWLHFGFKCFMKIIGPIMLALANLLIGGVMYIFVVLLLPEIAGNSLVLYAVHLTWGSFLFINVIFNYWNCAFTSAGSPEPYDDPITYLGQSNIVIDGRRCIAMNQSLEIVGHAASYRYCRHCRTIKPPRAHHDSITGKCVYHMDHFCPWMNNCVGFNNYRYFILFLFYMHVGCGYGIIILARPFYEIYAQDRPLTVGTDRDSIIMTVFSLVCAALFAVGVLLYWHVYLSLTNQTTIEFYINFEEGRFAKQRGEQYRNPFDKGWRKNLRRVFGDVPWYLSLCLSWRTPTAPDYPFCIEDYLQTEGAKV